MADPPVAPFLATGEGLPGGNEVLTPVRYGHTTRPPFYGVYCTDGAKGGLLRGRSIALHECGDDMQSMPPFHYSIACWFLLTFYC